jgi:hypothetical protein
MGESPHFFPPSAIAYFKENQRRSSLVFRRNKSRQLFVHQVKVLTVSNSSVIQVGDVFGCVDPFTYSEAYGGYRGAPSFATKETAEPINSKLHIANQVDEDTTDYNFLGEGQEANIPNIRGVKAR